MQPPVAAASVAVHIRPGQARDRRAGQFILGRAGRERRGLLERSVR